MLSRHLKKIEQGESVLYRVIVESDPCTWGTQESRFLQFEILRYAAEDPTFTACGPSDFKRMIMLHDGIRWILEAEVTIKS
jgi:hypothetical protein